MHKTRILNMLGVSAVLALGIGGCSTGYTQEEIDQQLKTCAARTLQAGVNQYPGIMEMEEDEFNRIIAGIEAQCEKRQKEDPDYFAEMNGPGSVGPSTGFNEDTED